MFVSNILAVKDTGFFYDKINGYNRKPDYAILRAKIEKQISCVKTTQKILPHRAGVCTALGLPKGQALSCKLWPKANYRGAFIC